MTRDEAIAVLAAPGAGAKLARRVRALLVEGRGARRCKSCGDRFLPPSRFLIGWTPKRCALCRLARQIAADLDRRDQVAEHDATRADSARSRVNRLLTLGKGQEGNK